jgi:hypothetical protein
VGIMGAIIQMNFKHATLRRGDAMESKLSNAEKNSEQAANPEKDSGQAFQGAAKEVQARRLFNWRKTRAGRPLLLGRFQGLAGHGRAAARPYQGLSEGQRGAYICFCETNPPFFGVEKWA